MDNDARAIPQPDSSMDSSVGSDIYCLETSSWYEVIPAFSMAIAAA